MNRCRGLVVAGLAALAVAGCGSTLPPSARTAAALNNGTGGGLNANAGTLDSGTSGAAAGAAGAGSTTTAVPLGPASSQPGVATSSDSAGTTPPSSGTPLPPTGPLTIGIVVLANDSSAVASLGLKSLNNGDERAEADAIVAYINSHGGLAGHRLVPLYFSYSPTQSGTEAVLEQSACVDFTQDHHVFAAIGEFESLQDVFARCMEHAGVPVIQSLAVVSTGDRKLTSDLPDVYFPAGLLLEEQASSYAAALAAEGFFHPGAHTGILAIDDPTYHRVVSDVLLPALAAVHANVNHIEYYSSASAGDTITQTQSAELHFRSDGDTQILTLEDTGDILFLMEEAQLQGYTGFRYALSTTDDPAVLEQTAPASQLANVVGMGWAPAFDVDLGHVGTLPPRQALCHDLLTRAGQSQTNQNTFSISVTICEALWFLQAAIEHAPAPLSRFSLRQGVAALGTSYASAITLTSRVIPSEPGTAAEYRPFGYQASCSCLAYTGPPQPLQRG